MTGRRVFEWPGGTRYAGEWIDGKMTGRGEMRWPGGTRYDGYWIDG